MLEKCAVHAATGLECQVGITWNKYGRAQYQMGKGGGESMFLAAISKTVPAAAVVIKITIIIIKKAIK